MIVRRQVNATAIANTISLAKVLGHQLLRTRRDKSDPLAAIRRAIGGTGHGTPIRGKVRDVERRTEGGFVLRTGPSHRRVAKFYWWP